MALEEYILADESATGPARRTSSGQTGSWAMMLCQIMVEFQFDGKSQLVAVQTSQRNLVAPHDFFGRSTEPTMDTSRQLRTIEGNVSDGHRIGFKQGRSNRVRMGFVPFGTSYTAALTTIDQSATFDGTDFLFDELRNRYPKRGILSQHVWADFRGRPPSRSFVKLLSDFACCVPELRNAQLTVSDGAPMPSQNCRGSRTAERTAIPQLTHRAQII